MTPEDTTRKPRSQIRTRVPPPCLAWKHPTARVAPCSPGAQLWESRAELEAGTVHLHANTQNAFPRTPLLLMEALSLEPWKVWNTYFAPSLQLWELPSRTRGACKPGLQVGLAAGCRPRFPGQRTSVSKPRAAASPGPPGTKHPGPAGGARGLSARRRLSRLRALGMLPAPGDFTALPQNRQDPGFPGACWGARSPLYSCPSPLPLCCRLPELVTSRSLGHKAQRVAVWEKGWTMASSAQLFQARSPFGSACPQPGPRALARVTSREAVAGDFWGFRASKWGSGGQPTPARLTGAQQRLGGSGLHPSVAHPSLRSARRHSRRGGRDSGSWFAGLVLRLHWSGGAETAAPGPAGGVGRRGPDGGSVCASIGGAGEWGGGAGSGGSGAAGGVYK